MSEDSTIEIDICYNDYFIEVYTIDHRELKCLIQTLANDRNKSFKIGDKTFFKSDLNSVGIANQGYGFLFMDVNN